MTAQTLATLVLQDLGVLQEGATPSPAQSEQIRVRANHMVSGWQTQYGTVTAVERTVFDLVANKQSYTIGLGGDFNVPRPLTIPGAALWLNGLSAAQSVSGITRSGLTATVTCVAHGLAVGDEAYLKGAVQTGYNGLQTVETVPTANTFTFTVSDQPPVTPATGTITLQAVQGQPVEIPRPVITDSGYQYIQIKNLGNAQFTDVYYNTTYPLGTIWLWPLPNTDQNQLILYLNNVFAGFADLTTDYVFADLPGVAEALQYNLGARMAVPYGMDVPPKLQALADFTLGLVKRANNKLLDLPTDAALLTQDRRGSYNINTDQGGS